MQVVEASQDFVPLLLLTADRPSELLDVGANQAINQVEYIYVLNIFNYTHLTRNLKLNLLVREMNLWWIMKITSLCDSSLYST